MTHIAAFAPVHARPPLLRPAETILGGLMLAVALLGAAVADAKGQAVAWGETALILLPGSFLIGLGLYARMRASMARLATLCLAVGYYANFGNFVAVLIYCRFPVAEGASIDGLLERMDSAMGYAWPDAVAAVAAVPGLGPALALIYLSSLWQIVGLIALLALAGQEDRLHRLLLAGAMALLIAAAFWWVWPSFGPAVMHAIPVDVAERAHLVVGGGFPDAMRLLASEGSAVVSPWMEIGVVAFPSFHMVMACLVVWYARGTWAFWPAVALNVPMVLATLVQGGHHLVDLAGGLASFALATWIASRLARGRRHES